MGREGCAEGGEAAPEEAGEGGRPQREDGAAAESTVSP